MTTPNKTTYSVIALALSAALTAGCLPTNKKNTEGSESAAKNSHEAPAKEVAKGPQGGLLLEDGDFALEMTLFETGVPPEYRVYPYRNGKPIDPGTVNLKVTLTRLGDRIDSINFVAQDDFLRGDQEIYEPHSFVVTVDATAGGTTHRWQYDNFEGRTQIAADMAEAFELKVEQVGPTTIEEVVETFGRIEAVPGLTRAVSARFDGPIRSVKVALGDYVTKGQLLASVESNESLRPLNITAPIDGVVTAQLANAGEQTADRQLFEITDLSRVQASLSVFPKDRARVKRGNEVSVVTSGSGTELSGRISRFGMSANANQSTGAYVELANPNGTLLPGMHISARIKVDEYTVPLSVKRSGLQGFRDFTVVFAQIGDVYEVRMLELGRQDREQVEVLGGIEAGTRYVSEGSYLIKADIEKSGASHDH